MEQPIFDLEQARQNMVEQQIRPWNVLDNQLLDLISGLPRDRFVSEEFRSLAYADTQIPIGHSQCMMPPREEARMLQALRIQPSDVVLEVGTGTGYCTALMAQLAHKVYSIDIVGEFIEQAQARTLELGLENIEFEEGDAATGWPHYKPYDVIAITGSFYKLPKTFKRHLPIGGRLFCIVGQEPAMKAKLITRTGEDEWHEEILFETVLPYLINAKRAEQFEF